MPSPFPGMDPFIESQKWEDFHARFVTAIGDALVPVVRPKYIVDVERRIYLERIDPTEPVQTWVADAAIYHRFDHLPDPSGGGSVAIANEPSIKPKVCTIPYSEEHRETFITIRRGSPARVVTVIELLSPTNKRKGTEGRDQYLERIHALLKTSASLVEIDLLRGGERPAVSNPPPGDYFAMVSKPQPRPLAEVYAWSLADPLPRILIPLSIEDPDVPLDLQAAFNLVYDRAGYDYAINYQQPVAPPLSETEQPMIAKVVDSMK